MSVYENASHSLHVRKKHTISRMPEFPGKLQRIGLHLPNVIDYIARMSKGALLVAIGAIAAASAGIAGNAPPPALIAAGKTAFAQCMACHSVTPGQVRMGPNLANIVARKAGGLDGYAYSPAMKAAAFAWDAEHLDAFLANPRAIVPGTKMAYRGITDPAQRAALIAYLGAQKGK
jgi:cytochrome c